MSFRSKFLSAAVTLGTGAIVWFICKTDSPISGPINNKINDIADSITTITSNISVSPSIEQNNAVAEEIDAANDITLIKARIVRVVDGDTIVVDIDGVQQKVRLIGIDTPESVASQEYLDRTGKENTEQGKNASEYTKALLANYEYVYLEADAQDTDRYGRALRYVWLDKPSALTVDEIRDKMLNAILLDSQWANIATYPPNVKYVDIFTEISHEAYGSSQGEIEK